MTSDRESSESAGPEHGARPERRLHLPSLSIQGFRGIRELSIPHLGRVTLLAGKNGVGKTTVLDAVRVHASRARLAALSELLTSREEIAVGADVDGVDGSRFDGRALFHGRGMSEDTRISIGPLGGEDEDRLVIGVASLSGETDPLMEALLGENDGRQYPGHEGSRLQARWDCCRRVRSTSPRSSCSCSRPVRENCRPKYPANPWGRSCRAPAMWRDSGTGSP